MYASLLMPFQLCDIDLGTKETKSRGKERWDLRAITL